MCDRLIAAALAAVLSATAAPAHEFWIDARPGQVPDAASVSIDLKVGVMFAGESYPYLSDRFVAFTDTVRGETRKIAGLEGDIPAAVIEQAASGLHVIAQQTVAFLVTYDDWALFARYLKEEGLAGIEALHRARGLPESGFAERYIRCVKALVQVGPVLDGDFDLRVGLPLELVAGLNPYAGAAEVLPVTLYWMGAPAAGHQITVYHEDGGDVARKAVVTDGSGGALVPLSGAGRYLLNAVHIEPYEAPTVAWQSHWASLTFSLEAD